MDLDELQRVRDAERSKDSLQELRDSFYADVADHLAELKDQRDRAAERSENPFGDPEIQQLTSEIDATEQVVESIYERRVGKLVKLASFAAADMPADENGLTREERKLFTDLVSRIKENRAHVLDVLAGEHVPEPTDPTDVESTSTGAEPESTDEPTETADPSTPASVHWTIVTAFLVNLFAFTLLYAYRLARRFRLAVAERRLEEAAARPG
jgi:DNA replication factor GINS